jgi:hypothetical protein
MEVILSQQLLTSTRAKGLPWFPAITRVTLKHFSWSNVIVGLIAIVGCGGEVDPTLPVSGTVTLNGKPVQHGDIEFGGKVQNGLRRGAMIVNGKYQTAPMQGLVPGEYIVRIFSVPVQANSANSEALPGDEELGPAASRDLIPPEYNMRSKQSVTVTAEGPNVFDFDIATKK